ncbi:MAG: PLP-dependent cysteine synthase family protein, partial [Cardiobacterium hominis]
MKYNSVLDTIGNTPIIRINRLAPKHVQLYVKTESRNPGGSVKDRLAYAVINDAEKRGLLKPGQTVVEATSGNTGIALAMVCAAKGYPFVAVMTETFSVERRKLIRSFGGKVILTPAAERGQGMVRVAKELADKNGWFLADQFANPANPQYHRETTAAEILRDFAGAGDGAAGAVTADEVVKAFAGEVLKAARPELK